MARYDQEGVIFNRNLSVRRDAGIPARCGAEKKGGGYKSHRNYCFRFVRPAGSPIHTRRYERRYFRHRSYGPTTDRKSFSFWSFLLQLAFRCKTVESEFYATRHPTINRRSK